MEKLLSLCMIAKDEEMVIERCLTSVQGLVDEIIVVDTGSTDRTKEIAFQFTDKIYDFQWTNDFSAARNEAIRRATSKWILIMDADEYINSDDHHKIKSFLEQSDHTLPQGFILPIINFTGTENSGKMMESFAVRILCNHPEVRFHRPIHEQVLYKEVELPVQKMNCNIFHTGYTYETTIKKNKRERNLSIFNEMKRNKQFEEYDYFTLANEYDALGDYTKALYYYRRADTKKSQNKTFIIHCKYKIITILAHLGRGKEVFDVVEECIRRWPQYIDFMYLKAHYLNLLGFSTEAAAIFEQCIQIADEQSRNNQNFWFISPTYSKLIYNELIDIYTKSHNYSMAVTLLIRVIESKTDELKDLSQLIHLLLQTDTVPDMISLLNRLYSAESPESALRLLQASLIVGNRSLCEYYYLRCMALSVKLESEYMLHYAAVMNDRSLFFKHLQAEESRSTPAHFNRLIGTALCLWKDPALINHLIYTEDNPTAFHTLQNLLVDHLQTSENIDSTIIYQLLTDLFKSEHYETYDWLINRYPDLADTLANRLGDFLYFTQQIEIAFDYYSMLLEKDTLNATGYENIALYYLKSGNIPEALPFLKKALDLSPTKLHLYPILLRHIADQEDKLKYSKKFNSLYPHYDGIAIIKDLLL
ncbi:glycosyltransferase [Paenibacillus guangzhouensis]|uniref:glycosyltransferase n=1 Tax=Paenibacillus guangzhouensis TaxID=1473112 RepID=UPI0012675576|nr:glycosyltransferase [Paenibacillus guangzhouensis]